MNQPIRAQTGTEKSSALATVLPGHHVQLVFKKDVSCLELLKLEQLEEEGFLNLAECKGAISLVLCNRKWRDEERSSRTFSFYITEQYTFDSFKAKLPVDHFESIVLLD